MACAVLSMADVIYNSKQPFNYQHSMLSPVDAQRHVRRERRNYITMACSCQDLFRVSFWACSG